jgi:hypothetical protein
MSGRLTTGTDSTGAHAEQVLAALDSRRIIVRLGAHLDPVAASAAAALISMLARVHAHVELSGDAVCGSNPWAASTAADVLGRIEGHRPKPAADADGELLVSFGGGPGEICIGGNDWTARIGSTPTPAAASRFGFGLHAAVAFGAAEVLKIVLRPLGMIAVPSEFEWNLLAYTFGHLEPPADGAPADRLLFAAAGSVNSSAAAVLMPTGSRSAHVVDPDSFDLARNPYRYPAATTSTTGGKAEWVAEMLNAAGWDATSEAGDIGAWVQSQPNPGLDGTVLSSVDSIQARADVTDVLARTTLSAGVDGLALHVQREHCFDDWSCPNCDFVDEGAPITQVQQYADMTGLDPARVAVLLEGDTLHEQDIQRLSVAGKVSAGPSMAGRRLADLIARVYAEASVPVAGTPLRVSAPFVSWIAGTILAAEACKPLIGAPQLDRRLDLDMAGIPTGGVGQRRQDQTGRCLCASPWRRRAAARRYRVGS